jgi:hypothetical protein
MSRGRHAPGIQRMHDCDELTVIRTVDRYRLEIGAAVEKLKPVGSRRQGPARNAHCLRERELRRLVPFVSTEDRGKCGKNFLSMLSVLDVGLTQTERGCCLELSI